MSLHCLQCGAPLETRELDGREREVCPACGWVYYRQLKLSVTARVLQEGRLLMVQRGISPWYGTWQMPSGYVEADEDPARAAEREAWEETGLRVQAQRLLGVYPYEDPRGNGVMLMYDCRVIGGAVQAGVESLQADFFGAADAVRREFAGEASRRQVLDWLDEEKL